MFLCVKNVSVFLFLYRRCVPNSVSYWPRNSLEEFSVELSNLMKQNGQSQFGFLFNEVVKILVIDTQMQGQVYWLFDFLNVANRI